MMSGSESEEEEVIPKQHYNNQELMKLRLEQLKSPLEWLHFLHVTSDMREIVTPGAAEETLSTKMEDDFKREMMFYCQAQVGAKEALSKLRDTGEKAERPEDYFAEMVKSDTHMQKVRQKLLNRKESMEKSEKAKKQRQLKKFGKKIQQEVLQKREEEKKKMLQAVDRIKKNKGKFEKMSGRNDEIEDVFKITTGEEKRRNNPGEKRKRKDDKFGFGGKKRRVKKNSAQSSAEGNMAFKRNIHGSKKNGGPQSGNFKPTGKGKAKRLGKSRRMKTKK